MSNNSERIANLVFGFNVWFWAVMVLVSAPPGVQIHPARVCISAMHFVVGGLFLLRRPVVRAGSWRDLLAAVPSIVVSGFAFGCALPCETWPHFATILFVLGTTLTIAAFLFLKHNFAVLPAARGVTRTGPYRWVRHPAYLGELTLILACVLARPSAVIVTIFFASVMLVAVRIRVEEKLLSSNSDAYVTYAGNVKYRLLPGIW